MQNREAILSAAHVKEEKLIAAIDCNGKQVDGLIQKGINPGDTAAKSEAFGWKVITLDKGNDMDELVAIFNNA